MQYVRVNIVENICWAEKVWHRSSARNEKRMEALRECVRMITANAGGCTTPFPFEAAIWLLEEQEELYGGSIPIYKSVCCHSFAFSIARHPLLGHGRHNAAHMPLPLWGLVLLAIPPFVSKCRKVRLVCRDMSGAVLKTGLFEVSSCFLLASHKQLCNLVLPCCKS